MEITLRSLWTMIHGMGFGALYLLACSGALVELYRFTTASAPSESTRSQERFLKAYLITMVVLAWAAVLTGAYVIYPWYRAAPPAGTVDLSLFPQRLLMAKSRNHRLALAWHGVEGARRLVRPHLHHHGRICLHPLRSRISAAIHSFAPPCWALPRPRFLPLVSPASSEP